MNLVDQKYSEGDIVYLVTDPDQYKRVITAYQVRSGVVTYELSFSSFPICWAQECELSANRNELIII